MTTTTETINGHTYSVTRDDQGNIISQAIAETLALLPILSRYAFMSLFTEAERITLNSYATSTTLTSIQKAELAAFQNDLLIAERITLNNPETVQGVEMLESLGLIATGRAAQVLAGQAPPSQ